MHRPVALLHIASSNCSLSSIAVIHTGQINDDGSGAERFGLSIDSDHFDQRAKTPLYASPTSALSPFSS